MKVRDGVVCGLLAIVVVASAALYLGPLVSRGDAGFPLDDAWIHQTYARNLVRLGQWSYEAGHPSTGSTAPLWTLALSAGYELGLDHRVWTFALGLAALGWLAWLARRLAARLFGGDRWLGFAVAAFCLLEWHLVWAAFSGMETLLFAALQLLCMERYLAFEETNAAPDVTSPGPNVTPSSAVILSAAKNPDGPRPGFFAALRMTADEGVTFGPGGAAFHGLLTGLCGGLLVMTRPEGLILLGLIGLWFLAARRREGRNGLNPVALRWAVGGVVGALLVLAPYAAFNLRTAGLLFPTTFYAKQAEYRAVIDRLSLPLRWAGLVVPVLAGGPIVLVPGFVSAVIVSLKERSAPLALLWVWWIGSVTLYAWRLPVAYQHGRYLIPTLPLFIVLGVGGAWRLVRREGRQAPWQRRPGLAPRERRPGLAPAEQMTRGDALQVRRLVGRSWLVAAAVVTLIFWVIGARAYRDDVGFINGEMGETADWLAQNVPPGAPLAVHDIGVVGYVLNRPFIDLAGLVTPEVIPFISDERRLLDYMRANRIEYLVVFPDWSDAYRRMVQDPHLVQVHSTGYAWTRAGGRANMTVYRTVW